MELSIDQIRDMLPINKHALDQHLMVRADITERIARKIAFFEHAVDSAKADLRYVAAQAESKARKSADKLTLAEVANIVALDPDCEKVANAMRNLSYELDQWKALSLGWKDQGFDLRGLVDLYQVQYFALDPAGSRSADRPRRELSDRELSRQSPDGNTIRRRTRI